MGQVDESYFNDVFSIDKPKEANETLEEKFAKERLEWTAKMESMSKSLKKVLELNDLMVIVYTERQRLVESYHYLLTVLSKINRKYRADYAAKYDFYSFVNNNRFPNETSKNNKILSELDEIVRKKDAVEIQVKFFDGTIKSVDHIIWGISKRIELEGIARGK